MEKNNENPGPLYIHHVLDAHFFSLTHVLLYSVLGKECSRLNLGEELPERDMSQNVQQQDEKENTLFFLCLLSVVIHLPDLVSFGSSDLFACLTRMLVFANCAVIIITLILAICEITWKTEDGEENHSSLSEIPPASLYICLVYLQKFLGEASCVTVI